MMNQVISFLVISSVLVCLGFDSSLVEGQVTYVSTKAAGSGAMPAQVAKIDAMIEQVWADYELKPSRAATDGEWVRRVYLDVLGRVATVEETRAFTSGSGSSKKLALVEKLLYDDEYTEEFARNWTTVWTNLLIGRTGGNDRNSMISREGMQKYIRDSFARGKSYDRFAYELVTATGVTTPGKKGFNGATNFLIDKVNPEKASLATSEVTKTFLGLQVQCTQCHNHPFNDWKQQKYWEVNAFFRQVKAKMTDGLRPRDGGIAKLVDQNFGGESGKNPEEAEIFYEKRNGEVSVAYPVFVDGFEIETSGFVEDVNRREEFAKLMIKSPYFGKSIANRMWAHFLGYGFTSPVDDLGPHNIPSNPELLDFLGQEIASSGFDLRQLITWITLSKPYGLSSRRTASNQRDDPLLGESPRFSHFYLRQMEAEQLYESMLVVTRAGQGSSYEAQEKKKNQWLAQFNQAFGTDEGQETTIFNGTIPQILMMFNGDIIKEATKTGKGGLIDSLVSSGNNYTKNVDYLFTAGFGRSANGNEKKLAKDFLSARGSEKEALRDIWWVILNSNEFIFNH